MIKPRKTLEKIIPYKTDKYKTDWVYKLDSNESAYGCSEDILETIKNLKIEDISLYPCYGKLIDKLASRYNLKEENILISNGCDEALSIIINSYLDYGDEILSFNPSFSMPALYSSVLGARVKLVDYKEKFVFSAFELSSNISSNTKIIYIATPNNPTGEIAPIGEVEELVANNQNILFILDCTYINYSTKVYFEEYLELIKKYNNAIVIKSFSKDFALAGLRLGFICSKGEIINNLKKVASPYNVNVVALNCAIAALDKEGSFLKIKENNNQAKTLLIEGLQKLGFKPHDSQANFVLCDFGAYSSFYWEKLKKNGIIVRNYSKNSTIADCLRITVPKIEGVKKILKLLEKKELLIFDLDGVVFDVSESYMSAIKETFKRFSGSDITLKDILEVKNLGGMNCDWDATKCLLERHGFEVALEHVVNVFQDLFYNPEIKKDNYLIDREKLLIKKEVFERLSKKYDLAVFSGRLRAEVDYSFKKYDIDKYFSYFVTSDNLPKDKLKPSPWGVKDIIEHCPYKTVKYIGDSVDDIIAGNKAGVETIGVISPGADYNAMKNNFKHLGASYILGDISDLEEFLGEINYAKSV